MHKSIEHTLFATKGIANLCLAKHKFLEIKNSMKTTGYRGKTCITFYVGQELKAKF